MSGRWVYLCARRQWGLHMNKAAGVFSDGTLLFAIVLPFLLPPIASAGETRGYPGGSDVGMARSGRFELPTPRFVVWCSIQLSYERDVAGLTDPRQRRPHHRPSICCWQARTSARNARHFVGRKYAFSLAIMCANTTLCWFSVAADTG